MPDVLALHALLLAGDDVLEEVDGDLLYMTKEWMVSQAWVKQDTKVHLPYAGR